MNKAFIAIIFIFVFEHVLGQLKPCTDRKDGWYEYDGNCYNFVDSNNTPRTWEAAQRWCQSMDSNLASVDNRQESEYITSARERLLNRYPTSWIGIQAVGLGSAFKWSDDSAVNFNNWRDSETPIPKIQTSCGVMIDTGKWLSTDCNIQLRSFICKRNSITFVPTIPPEEVDGNCFENWYKFEKKCYKFYADTVADGAGQEFDDAVKICEKSGATLASIHSEVEQDFLTASVGAFNNTLWIGAKRPSRWGGKHEWLDTTPFDFSNWAPGQPSSNYSEPCLEMNHLDNVAGKWNNAPCNKRLGFICKMHSVSVRCDASTTERCNSKNSYCVEALNQDGYECKCRRYETDTDPATGRCPTMCDVNSLKACSSTHSSCVDAPNDKEGYKCRLDQISPHSGQTRSIFKILFSAQIEYTSVN